MSKEQLLSAIEQIVREWNGLERGHLESALKVAVMRETPRRRYSRPLELKIRLMAENFVGKPSPVVDEREMWDEEVERAVALMDIAIIAADCAVVPVPAIVEVERLREALESLANHWEARHDRYSTEPHEKFTYYDGKKIVFANCANQLRKVVKKYSVAAAAPQSEGHLKDCGCTTCLRRKRT